MSFLEKLLDGLEVEWKALGEIVKTVTAPAKLKRESYRDVGKTPIIDQGVNFIAGYTDEDVKALPCNEYVIFGDHSEHIKYVDFSFIQGADGLKILKTVSDVSKYIYYAFQNFYQKELNYKRHWSRASETLIPIPCPENPKKSLEIQAEIVRILDTFTEMTTELTTELTARKKQYNYYRDQLLSFPCSSVGTQGEVEWKTLGEVAKIGTGSHDTQDAIEDGDYVFYARGREPLRLDVFDFDETAIITAGDGAGVGKVFHYAQGKYALHQRAYRIVPSEVMEPRFVYHCIRSYFYAYIQKASVSSSVTSLRRPMFLNFPIPVPSLAEQARIVAILDKFDALTNSISEGLPREIALRQKQYAYYRDLLLSFPKAKPETPLECGEITWIRSAK
ncbi:MAG: restriction endonuclease subunit S [Methylococcales bacterium]|nr:restriction endonuclease subunit S [Methylococcaceae bacterium]MDP2391824.1 restriction endonuclease subunit S [Methylococcaceae bacterium]MDP3391498.1 restriction endonuclease subunit S [Methylococcaceae bacterium]MDZ4155827.1 restriction endonuclease subunit S [Methylococcales bacterium]